MRIRINWQLVLIGVFLAGFLIYLGSGAHFGTVRMVPRIFH
jgi:hypothetical protein